MDRRETDLPVNDFLSESNRADQDMNYLKQYVIQHPTSKMGWYLLGKAYEAKGKEGKAQYCFQQAGEVYQAFEKTSIETKATAIVNPTKPIEQIHGSKYKVQVTKQAGLRWRYMMLFLLLLAIGLGPSLPELAEEKWRVESKMDPTEAPVQAYTSDQVEKNRDSRIHVLFSSPSEMMTRDSLARVAGELLFPSALYPSFVWVQGAAASDPKWTLWPKKPIVLLSAERKPEGEEMSIYYYDAQTCACLPTDPTEVNARARTWMSLKEQEAILRTAIAAYRERVGNTPESLEQLTGNYPENWLSGYTEVMKEIFDEWVIPDKVAETINKSGGILPETTITKTTNGSISPEKFTGSTQATNPLHEPLQIIVDKKNHRLALVSGMHILRSYPVGLGGSRTPEGEFMISEKVKNPNGRSNGDFGSRGMTLSDTLFAIHGTNRPASVGKDESLGCVRMLKEDVEELYAMVPLGTKVRIGNDLLPGEIVRSPVAFEVPARSTETNPRKIYNWLN